jgi:hypothetical protein
MDEQREFKGIDYTEVAKEMQLMVDEIRDKDIDYPIRKVHAFGFEEDKRVGSKRNVVMVEVSETFYQNAMMRILKKRGVDMP